MIQFGSEKYLSKFAPKLAKKANFGVNIYNTDVASCRMIGEMRVQSASGSLQCSSDGGRMLKSWSVMRFKGTYL